MKTLSFFMIVVASFVLSTCGSSVFTEEEVTWENSEVTLAGTLYVPEGDGPHPAAIFIHGSDNLSRSDKLFLLHAERMARAGLAMLIYDKRGCGESTGDWKKAVFSDLADDALAGIRLLQKHSRIDKNRIGFFGSSQGGWIALFAASRFSNSAFIATLSAAPMTPAEQGNYIVEARLHQKGYTGEEIAKALALERRVTQVFRSDSGWAELQTAVEKVSAEPWFKDAGIAFQPRESWNWRWYRDLPMDFDPLPILKKLDVPIFFAHGERDMLMPAQNVLRYWNQSNENTTKISRLKFFQESAIFSEHKKAFWLRPGFGPKNIGVPWRIGYAKK